MAEKGDFVYPQIVEEVIPALGGAWAGTCSPKPWRRRMPMLLEGAASL